MDLVSELRAFLAVADEEHVTRGAERLGLAQPAVSRQLRALERTLGVELFTRTGRRVVITPYGRRLVPLAQDLLERVDRILELPGTPGRGARPSLRLALPPAGDVTLLAEAIRVAADEDIALELMEGAEQERRKRLADGRVHAALVRSDRDDADFRVPLGFGVAPDTDLAVPGVSSAQRVRRPLHLNALRGRAGRRRGLVVLIQPEDSLPVFLDTVVRTAARAGLTPDQIVPVGTDTPAPVRVLAGEDVLLCSRPEASRYGLRWRPSGDGFERWYAWRSADAGERRPPDPIDRLLRRAHGGRASGTGPFDDDGTRDVPAEVFG